MVRSLQGEKIKFWKNKVEPKLYVKMYEKKATIRFSEKRYNFDIIEDILLKSFGDNFKISISVVYKFPGRIF